MARTIEKGLDRLEFNHGVYGNLYVMEAPFTLVNGLAAGSEHRIAPLPLGVKVYEIILVIEDAAASGDLIDIGTYQDDDNGDWTDDDDYFFTDIEVSATARKSSLSDTQHKPLFVDKDKVFLEMKVPSGNAIGAAGSGRVLVLYSWIKV